jgi:hypothetical protein
MSGGHWNYLQWKFDEAAEGPGNLVKSSLELLGQIEHELDWGHSCDTCLACARLRVLAALDRFYDDCGQSTLAALAILRDSQAVSNYCDECLSKLHTWGRREGAKPTVAERDQEVLRRMKKGRLHDH